MFYLYASKVNLCVRYPKILKGGIRSPGTGVIASCELPSGCWDLNSCPLQEQPVLLTSTQLTLYSFHCYYIWSICLKFFLNIFTQSKIITLATSVLSYFSMSLKMNPQFSIILTQGIAFVNILASIVRRSCVFWESLGFCGCYLFKTLAIFRQISYKFYFGVFRNISFRDYYMVSQHKHF